MNTYKDTHHRSILKTLSWRVRATILIVFAFTRKIILSTGIGAVEAVVNLILYYLHEKIWAFLGIGRKEHPLSPLPLKKASNEKGMQIIKDKLRDLGYISEE